MRFRYLTLAMAGIVVILVQPVTAQMAPARPNVVGAQINQAAPRPTVSTAQSSAPAISAVQAAPNPPTPAAGAKRDPFNPLLGRSTGTGAPGPDRLPPGKAGLTVGTVRLDGLVRGPNGMIAVVSNPQQRVYFLREGDRIFDGRVLRISLEAITFQQTGRDAFGNSLEHEVTRRLYPNPGEQR